MNATRTRQESNSRLVAALHEIAIDRKEGIEKSLKNYYCTKYHIRHLSKKDVEGVEKMTPEQIINLATEIKREDAEDAKRNRAAKKQEQAVPMIEKPSVAQPQSSLFEYNRIADYTDKELVAELRKRGYEVRCTKTTTTEI